MEVSETHHRVVFPKYIDLFRNYDKLSDIFVCGGYLRDYILSGKFGKDIDVFIPCTPLEFQDLLIYLSSFGRIEYGQYGSPRFYPNECKNSYIDIVPFYNFIVADNEITDINSLLDNFDFSANAIAYNLKNNTLIDTHNGLKDINNRVLRALRTDFPEKYLPEPINLSTNTVFWFRLLNYQNALKFVFEENTKKWILDNAWRYRDIEIFKQYFFEPCVSDEMKMQLGI